MIHFFSSGEKYPFTDETLTEPDEYFNPVEETGMLANYLLDQVYYIHIYVEPNRILKR